MSRTDTIRTVAIAVLGTVSAVLLGAVTGCAQDSSQDTPPASNPTPLPGQVMADPQLPAWFRYTGGTPFFLCGPGDPEGFLYRGRRLPDGTRDGDQGQIIAKLARSGANGLYMQIVRSHGGDGEPDHNPFVDSSPANPLDEDILGQWDEWFRAHG